MGARAKKVTLKKKEVSDRADRDRSPLTQRDEWVRLFLGHEAPIT